MQTKRNIIWISLFIVFQIYSTICFAADLPKREFRGAWIASVANIDWPSSPGLSVSKQKQDLRVLLDELKFSGINAVFFQIRPECDALYESNYEPWSYWLSGKQGTPPSPYYDPLAFAIEEAHKRGMELHAWFNPYRAERAVGNYPLDESHVVVQHPEWVFTFTKDTYPLKILNPGIPMVREYVRDVVMDVVWNYDIDGIHFDDYFYPYPPNHITQSEYSNIDYQTYQDYKHGDASDNNIGDWRRENVNILMRIIHDSIQVVKPYVKFGISPFGIYKNGVPPGIKGLDAYNVIFADPLAWLRDKSVDYLIPQLYWKIGGDQDFFKLMNWWADNTSAHERHLYTGHIFSSSYSSQELPNQLNLTRERDDIYGNVWFSAKHFPSNSLGFATKLKSDLYRFKSLLPQMAWKDSIAPNIPQNLSFGLLNEGQLAVFYWDLPDIAVDGDSAFMYAVYRFDQEPLSEAELENPENLFDLTGSRIYNPIPPKENLDQAFFVLTSLDRNYNESGMSNYVMVIPPDITDLYWPLNGDKSQPDTLTLSWHYSNNTSSYKIEVSADSLFSEIVVQKEYILDTTTTISGFEGQKEYYWRVAAQNPAGTGEFSSPYMFKTAFPSIPLLAYPEKGASNVPLDTVLSWYASEAVDFYRVQLAQSQYFQEDYIIMDTIVAGDTSLVVTNLEPFKRLSYYWRVKASNEYGSGSWSETWNFRTVESTGLDWFAEIPLVFNLRQNYPNPFNAKTKIAFTIAEPGQTTLTVYDMVGRQVAVLVDEYKQTGQYSVDFDGNHYASGVYIYQLSSKNRVFNKKMVLLK